MDVVYITAGALALLLIISVPIIYGIYHSMKKSARDFFVSVRNENFSSAYQLLSKKFRKIISESELREMLSDTSLETYKDTDLKVKKMKGLKSGVLQGRIDTESAGRLKIIIKMIKEDGFWRIDFINKDQNLFGS